MTVDRKDFAGVSVTESPVPSPGEGEAVLRVDRVGMTANNITYAVLGDAFMYWRFFPAADPSQGVPPVWGFAEVVASTVAGVEPGQRYYGYYPAGSHLVVRPDRVDGHGFRDASPHRAELAAVYNAYRLTTGDRSYEAAREDLLILFRPLFFTSFLLADWAAEEDFLGARTLVLSSASSKTAYSTAFELAGYDLAGRRVVGLTSPGNAEFTRTLGCYDDVLTYDRAGELPAEATAYLDFAGRSQVRQALTDHLGDRLVRDVAIGLTAQSPDALGAAGEGFFAPEQIRKRTADWGRDGLEERLATAWQRFAAAAEGWVDVVEGRGPDGLRSAWLEVLSGRTPARTGHVIAL